MTGAGLCCVQEDLAGGIAEAPTRPKVPSSYVVLMGAYVIANTFGSLSWNFAGNFGNCVLTHDTEGTSGNFPLTLVESPLLSQA